MTKKRKFLVVISRSEVTEKEFEVEVESGNFASAYSMVREVAIEKAKNAEYPRAETAVYKIVLTKEVPCTTSSSP